MDLIEKGIVGRVRRHHAIEHATAHVLLERNPTLSLAGLADPTGFSMLVDVDDATLEEAAREGLRRLQNGQGHLAVHPRCGTQLVVTGTLTALAAFVTLGRRRRVARLPDVIWATTLASMVAQPLGLLLQRLVTTSADVRGARIRGLRPIEFLGVTLRHVDIEWDKDATPVAAPPT